MDCNNTAVARRPSGSRTRTHRSNAGSPRNRGVLRRRTGILPRCPATQPSKPGEEQRIAIRKEPCGSSRFLCVDTSTPSYDAITINVLGHAGMSQKSSSARRYESEVIFSTLGEATFFLPIAIDGFRMKPDFRSVVIPSGKIRSDWCHICVSICFLAAGMAVAVSVAVAGKEPLGK